MNADAVTTLHAAQGPLSSSKLSSQYWPWPWRKLSWFFLSYTKNVYLPQPFSLRFYQYIQRFCIHSFRHIVVGVSCSCSDNSSSIYSLHHSTPFKKIRKYSKISKDELKNHKNNKKEDFLLGVHEIWFIERRNIIWVEHTTVAWNWLQ